MPFGEPIIAANSVKAGTGEGEKISLKPGRTGDYYIVVKWVSGDGDFKLLRLPMVKATVRASFLGLPLNTLDIEAPGRAGQKYYVLVAEAPAIDELGGAFGGLRTGLTLYGREAVTEGNLDADGKASVAAGEMSGHKGFMQIIVCPGGAGNCAGGAVSEVIHIEL